MDLKGKVPYGTLCWAEYHAKDTEAASKFYTEIFGWNHRSMESEENAYHFFQVGSHDICGMIPTPEEWKNAPYWNPYIAVKDIEETIGKIEALGGKVRIPAIDIPDGGRVACVEDPQGAVFGVFQP